MPRSTKGRPAGATKADETVDPPAVRESLRAAVSACIADALRWARAGGPAWRFGRHSAYRLPWYLVIGEQGAGKSAMLAASGRVRGDGHGAIEDDGACVRWWFDEHAMLLEATISDEGDALWPLLSHALKRARRRCPVNGVIVAVSARWFIDRDDAGRRCYANLLRGRLDTLYRAWNRRIPVYVMVTQCDCLTGFDAFVGDVSDEVLTRPLGWTFPLTREPIGEAWTVRFAQGFDSMTDAAQAHMIERMPVRADALRSAMIYRFPKSLGALKVPLGAFLRDTFGVSPRLSEPLLRGVHFCAAQGRGLSLSQDLPAPSPAVAPGARPCFIDGFWRHAVYADRDLARSKHAMPHSRVIRRHVAAASFVAIATVIGAGIVTAYWRASAAIQGTAQPAAALVRLAQRGVDSQSPSAMLALLDAARALPCGAAWQRPTESWLARLIPSRETHLEAACRAAYRTVLRETLQPYVMTRMTAVLGDASTAPLVRFDTLRAYLMLGEKARYDRSALLAWIERDAARSALPGPVRAAVLAHAASWVDGLPCESALPLDAGIIADARARLRDVSPAQRVFDAVQPALAAAMPEVLSLADMAGPGVALVLYRKSGAVLSAGVPAPYTLAGARRYLQLRDAALARTGGDAWVLGATGGAQTSPRSLARDVDNLYLARYVRAWDVFIDDVGLRTLPNSEEGAATVTLLAGADSPLRGFLARAAKETTFAPEAGAPTAQSAITAASAPPAGTVRRSIDALRSTLRRWFATGPSLPVARAADAEFIEAAGLVDRHFHALHGLMRGKDGASALDRAQAELKEVAVYLQAVGVARASGLPAPPDEALERLAQDAVRMPAPLGGMLAGLARDGTSAAQSGERARINALWRASAGEFCHAAIDGRYPFDANAGVDTTLDDFARVFAPGGLIDVFFQAHLKPFVDTTHSPWIWRARVAPHGMSIAALREFERAARIREAFFRGPSKAMDVRFALTARNMDAGLTRFAIALGGQTLTYMRDAPRATRFEWPDRSGDGAARIDYAPAGNDGRQGWTEHGAWALFRLLDRARLDARTDDRFVATFDVDGRAVALDLAASSVVNPFSWPALREFRCPSRL